MHKRLIRKWIKTKTVLLKVRAQSYLLPIVSNSINKSGTYPSFLNLFLSKNLFQIPKFRENSRYEVETRVGELLVEIRKYSRVDNEKLILEHKGSIKVGNNREAPRLVFLTSGPSESITNTVLQNIANSYDSNFSTVINQQPIGDQLSASLQLENVFDSIIEFKPDYLFFELHTLLGPSADNTIFSLDFVKRIKDRTGLKVLIVCFDIWRDFDVKFLEYWSAIADGFLHIDEASASAVDKEFPMIFWPYPALNHTDLPQAPKLPGLFFQGSIREFDRRKLLVFAARICKKYALPFRLKTFSHHNKIGVPSNQDYVHSLSQAQFCLGLGQKSKTHWLTAFRSIEAISAGAVLLQQTGPSMDPLSFLYTPYLHYMPFNTSLDIQAILFLCKYHEEEMSNLAKAALTYHNSLYRNERLWEKLFSITSTLGR